MSTKTTLKRVALVAVAAMGLGLLSVAPSSAAAQSDTLAISPATSTATVGQATAPTATITQTFQGLGGDTMTVTAALITFPSGSTNNVSLAAGNTANNVNGTPAFSGGIVSTLMDTGSASVSSNVSGEIKATLNGTLTAGTYVIKFTPAVTGPIAATAAAAAVTWTITVGGTPAATAADSTWGMIAGVAAPVDGTHTAINTVKAVSTTQNATILVHPRSAPATDTGLIKLTATVSGPGTLGSSSSTSITSTGRAITSAAGSYYFGVFGDGTAGTAVVTITEPGGVVLATATVNFADSLASYTLTPANTITKDNGTDTVTIAGKDAAGVTAPLGTYYVSSSNTAVATVTTTGQTGSTFTVTGAGVGTAVITVANALTAPTITKTYTVTVGKHTIKTVTITTDAASYASGGAVVVTVTALGSDGLPVGDGSYNAFTSSGITSNLAVQGSLPTSGLIAFVGGKKTYTIYAPAQDGTVTLTGTEGSDTDNVIANTSTAAATITASFESVNASSSAAVDAANAATDAANYAADAADAATTAAQEATAAAQAAQDSADAATAAVVALGLRVNVLMASVRAQLTSLSNLLVRIIKKTHA